MPDRMLLDRLVAVAADDLVHRRHSTHLLVRRAECGYTTGQEQEKKQTLPLLSLVLR